MANMVKATFANNETELISGSYIEFAERRILPKFLKLSEDKITSKHRRDGLKLQMLIRFLKAHLLNKQLEIENDLFKKNHHKH